MEAQPDDLHEAVLLYTHTKIELAKRIKEGISYTEFLDYEKKLEQIDRILKKAERQLEKEVFTGSG
ncbi:MAG: hypothetical protein JXK07_10245 [Spirochaetes bacterium]|nr:hypothetical protein [Spirochaetota bacterium]MBN2769923.1 hypothetical protein [Spirochaetota bacterium]